ncbi:MAG: hypothetical protein H7288_05125 [Kineosporiaceae bacterium]|nr:hypothetical protein [Aeromicrobium sp.]
MTSILTVVLVLATIWMASETRRTAVATRKSVASAEERAKQMRQPSVWADVRIDKDQGTLLHLLVGNSGPTHARQVIVKIDPPLPVEGPSSELSRLAFARLANGIQYLAPGSELSWSLGRSFALLESDASQLHNVRITAVGPYGPVEPVEYELDLADFRESQDRPEGNLHHVRKAIEEVAARLPKE